MEIPDVFKLSKVQKRIVLALIENIEKTPYRIQRDWNKLGDQEDYRTNCKKLEEKKLIIRKSITDKNLNKIDQKKAYYCLNYQLFVLSLLINDHSRYICGRKRDCQIKDLRNIIKYLKSPLFWQWIKSEFNIGNENHIFANIFWTPYSPHENKSDENLSQIERTQRDLIAKGVSADLLYNLYRTRKALDRENKIFKMAQSIFEDELVMSNKIKEHFLK